MSFKTPIKAIQYLLKYTVNMDELQQTDPHTDITDDLISDILNGASAFATDILAPINHIGDQNPATLKDDKVFASPGFKDAYQSWVEGGWQALSMPHTFGGMNLPQSINVAACEMFYGANMAFGLCPMLTSSAIKAIMAHASAELQATYLEKMVTGEWSGAMNLTEPQAGSDLGVLRTKASPNPDGTYAITGQKIFITWGDHDCTENIIHLVLARLPDAPEGSKGISLFLCPKFLSRPDGSLGEKNRFKAISLEHKLGIHGSPTCVMEFDGATGWLIGAENRGLACMFTMMNEARLYVGVQGVAIGERAYQASLNFSHERVQGRVLDQPPQTPIIGHPDIRRMLLDMKSSLMGARAICMATAMAGDMALAHEDQDMRQAAHIREALLTPIAKAYGSDVGVSVSSTALQVFGGMGYIEETGAAQHYRDSRIAPIYEGTNGIQAIDLVGRKVRRDGGAGMQALIAELNAILDLIHATHTQITDRSFANIKDLTTSLGAALNTLKDATDIIVNADEFHALSVATPYLNLCAQTIASALLIKASYQGAVAQDPGAPSMHSLASYHAHTVLPRGAAQLEFIKKGSASLAAFPQERLTDL